MVAAVLSYTLAAIAALVLWLAGSRKFRAAWSVGLASEVLWVWYALLIHQPAILIMTGIYAASYGRNLVKQLDVTKRNTRAGNKLDCSSVVLGDTIVAKGGMEMFWNWWDGAFDNDQCDTCGEPAAGYWVTTDPESGRRVLVAACHVHAQAAPAELP